MNGVYLDFKKIKTFLRDFLKMMAFSGVIIFIFCSMWSLMELAEGSGSVWDLTARVAAMCLCGTIYKES